MEARRSSLELLLDERAEAQVRALWRALADAGLSSLARHEAPSNRPHVTLLALAGLSADAAPQDVPLPVPLVLGPPLLMGEGDRRVLALAIVPSAELLALQRQVRQAAGGDDAQQDPHFAAGRWLPHVTLARRLRLADAAQALALMGPSIEAHAVALRHWDPETATITTIASAPAS
ncbi:2'-5' RNA ligase family protein [Agrococcus sp. Marseille-P2731]|uniref:2'-5' RNA ligase family protein n=1 Tax=Agrococcus sp. Marseille-P2731 TaxID=1841862 RepID=UPI0009310AFC|nr:2'-5' RNA ligase family protein [Agrococcus sp. Marseille-P2731]